MMKLPLKNSERQQKLVAELGPQAIDASIRQAIRVALMSLPDSKRSVQEVEVIIRDILERALQDMKSDLERMKQRNE